MPKRSGGGGWEGGDEELRGISVEVWFEMMDGTAKVLLALGEMEMDGDDRMGFSRLKKRSSS